MTLTSSTDRSGGGTEISGASNGTAAEAAAAAAPSAGSDISSSNDGSVSSDTTGPSTRRSSRSRKRTSFLSYSSVNASDTGSDVTAAVTTSATAVQHAKRSSTANDPYDFGNVNPAALSDREFEKLLEQYEEDGVHERAEKKRRLERGYGDDDYRYTAPDEPIPFDSLPSPCIELVFEMLPTVRSVFNLAFQSKSMLSHVEERTDIIVRAAVHGNADNQNKNRPKRTMTRIVNMVRNRSIHVPGNIRLLRLLNATRCERDENCWGFNLENKLASSRGVDSNRPYSMALCSQCANDIGRSIVARGWWSHWARGEKKIVVHGWNNMIHPNLASDLAVAPGGEKVGPRINARQIHQICNRHPGNIEAQKEAFGELVKTVYGEEGSEERKTYEKECTDLIDIFDTAEGDLKSWLKERSEKRNEASSKKNAETLARRKEKLEPIIAALEAAVANAPNKELIEHEWSSNPYRAVIFKVDFVRQAMSNLISAPSSASRKKVTAVCGDVRRKLVILSKSKDFWSWSFLSTAIKTSSGLTKRVNEKLLEYCQVWLPRGPNAHVRAGELDVNDRLFDLLEEKKYNDALLHIMEARGALGRVTPRILVGLAAPHSRNKRLLVGEVWKKVADERPRNDEGAMPNWTWTSFLETLGSCRREFNVMKENVRDYLNDPAVKAYIANQNEDLGNPLPRQVAVDQAWRPASTVIRLPYWEYWAVVPPNIRAVRPYYLLLERDFVLLLEVHRYYVGQRTYNMH